MSASPADWNVPDAAEWQRACQEAAQHDLSIRIGFRAILSWNKRWGDLQSPWPSCGGKPSEFGLNSRNDTTTSRASTP